MYYYEKRVRAVKLYIQYDHSSSAVIHELGYPSKSILRSWYTEYIETGTLHEDKQKLKFTKDQRAQAVEYYVEHGRSISRTVRVLGYP